MSGTHLQNRYRIVRQLGKGGMGAVYEAVDERLSKIVAVKELIVEGDKLHRAFEREARRLAHLSHPSLPRVTDRFVEGTRHYLVMDFLPGDDLKALLLERDAPFPVGDVLRWWEEMLDVLEYLHGHEPPVIHRDIKPANLKLLNNGRIVLLDFGLSKGGSVQTQSVTISRSLFGYSPHYAPLEQIRGMSTDARSDLYSLSATIYHLLTGVMPPDALTRAAAVFNEEQDPLIPLGELNRNVPSKVVRLIMSGLGLKTTERLGSAAEMRHCLKNLSLGDPTDADEEVNINTHDPNTRESVEPSASSTTPSEIPAALVPPVKFESQMHLPPTLKYQRSIITVVVLFILVAISSGGYLLLSSRGKLSEGMTVKTHSDTSSLPPQLKPASAAVLSLSATDADGQEVAGGGGFFVTAKELVAPLSAIEGATIVSVFASGEKTPRHVACVTRVDRERGVAVMKVEGEGGAALSTSTGASPDLGEKVKLLGLGSDLAVHSSDGTIVALNKSALGVHTTELSVRTGWLAFRESGDFLGLLTAGSMAGDFALFTPSALAELMRKKVVPQAVKVTGANVVLYDTRDAADDVGRLPTLGKKEQATIFNAVFGPRQPFANDPFTDCEEKKHERCLVEDRAAGRIEPEVLAKEEGPFTQSNAKQIAYLIAVHEEHSTQEDNFGTKRLVIFDGQRLVVNIDIGDYGEILKTCDLNRDGTSELLLASSYSQMGKTVRWAELVDLRGGKLSVIKDFDKVYMDDCADIDQDTKMFGTLILYTPEVPSAFPSGFRQDVYRSNCGANAAWKYLVNGKMPAI